MCESIGRLVNRQKNDKRRARECLRVVTGRFDPDLATVHIDNALGNGKPEPGSSGLEGCFPGTVFLDIAHFIEFVKDAFLIAAVNADAGVANDDFDDLLRYRTDRASHCCQQIRRAAYSCLSVSVQS